VSPFKIRSPVVFVEFLETGHEIKNLVVRRVPDGMIALGGTDNDINDIWEAATTAAALLHRMIDLGRHDQLPAVLIEKSVDGFLDLLFGDEIATANQHGPNACYRIDADGSLKQRG
jgi:hypothetical protein